MTEFKSLSMEASVKPGTAIETACKELVGLADKLGTTIEAHFNGVILLAQPGGDANILAENWHQEMLSKRSYKIAASYAR